MPAKSTTAASEIVQVLVEKSLDLEKERRLYQKFAKLMDWCSISFRKLRVRTNADTPEQVANAVAFGAAGIGLCRTEHMFFEGNRIDAMREMILAKATKNAKLPHSRSFCPISGEDFVRNLHCLEGLPGDHPFPGSASSRVPAARQRATE